MEFARLRHRSPASRATTLLSATLTVVVGAARKGFGKLASKAEQRRVEHALHAMPDHLLKDIGISRGAIHSRVQGIPD
ncbi:MAG: DUF1127 domain-containing protein [Mesorhizobium sp.]